MKNVIKGFLVGYLFSTIVVLLFNVIGNFDGDFIYFFAGTVYAITFLSFNR